MASPRLTDGPGLCVFPLVCPLETDHGPSGTPAAPLLVCAAAHWPWDSEPWSWVPAAPRGLPWGGQEPPWRAALRLHLRGQPGHAHCTHSRPASVRRPRLVPQVPPHSRGLCLCFSPHGMASVDVAAGSLGSGASAAWVLFLLVVSSSAFPETVAFSLYCPSHLKPGILRGLPSCRVSLRTPAQAGFSPGCQGSAHTVLGDQP